MRHMTLLPLVALLVACNGSQSETGDTGPTMRFGRTDTSPDTCAITDDGTVVLLTTPDQPQGVAILRCVEDDAGDTCTDFTAFSVVNRDGKWNVEVGGTYCAEGNYYLISYW